MNNSEIKKLWKRLRQYPNVVGFDSELRPKIRKGKEYPEILSIRVFVSKKIPIEDVIYGLRIWDKIKRIFGGKKNPEFFACDLVPMFIDDVPTDIVEVGDMKALSDTKQRRRPVIAGISGCHKDCTACTITGFFLSENNEVLVGFNNHCAALENKAQIGDPLIQPSPYDGGSYPLDQIATLHHYVEIKFNGFACPFRNFFHKIYRTFQSNDNKVDIAFGLLSVEYKVEALDILNAFIGWRDPDLNEQVQKTGRTTGYTEGIVVSLNYSGSVSYGRGVAFFIDCILIEGTGFSAGGDSGSPVFDMKGNLVGILFAGSSTHTIICKVGNVLTEGKVKLLLSE